MEEAKQLVNQVFATVEPLKEVEQPKPMTKEELAKKVEKLESETVKPEIGRAHV